MSNDKGGQKKLQKFGAILIFFITLVILSVNSNFTNQNTSTPSQNEENSIHSQTPNGEFYLTMIDVGQADSFLFVQNGKYALVDCGTSSTGKDVVKYLKKLGITKLDFVFGTHPHDDHMGGMYDVITSFDVGKIIIPEIKKGDVTTNWYIKLMSHITSNNYEVEYAKVGNTYTLGDAIFYIIGPKSTPSNNLNNYSTVMKVTFGQMDIIMTGDAEKEIERELLESGINIDAEVLKIGHHGSDTSTSDEFLKAVSPDYALISTKVGNKYNHPIKSTMDKLKQNDIFVYRTDENGTVTATITSNNIKFSSTPGSYLSGTELIERNKK